MKISGSQVLLDTGPLVAFLRKSDPYSQRCSSLFAEISAPVTTCWPVITEAAYLLRKTNNGFEALCTLLADETILCLSIDQVESARWMSDFRTKFKDQDVDLADAALMFLGEQHGIRQFFTLDSHFSVYRFSDGSAPVILAIPSQ